MKRKQRTGHIRAKENNSNKAKNLHQDFGYLFLNMHSNANATVCSVFFVVFFNLQKPIFNYFLIMGVMPNEFAKGLIRDLSTLLSTLLSIFTREFVRSGILMRYKARLLSSFC